MAQDCTELMSLNCNKGNEITYFFIAVMLTLLFSKVLHPQLQIKIFLVFIQLDKSLSLSSMSSIFQPLTRATAIKFVLTLFVIGCFLSVYKYSVKPWLQGARVTLLPWSP